MAREIGAVEDDRLVITPADLKQPFHLAAMVEAITDENVHDEIAAGAPVGKEYW